VLANNWLYWKASGFKTGHNRTGKRRRSFSNMRGGHPEFNPIYGTKTDRAALSVRIKLGRN